MGSVGRMVNSASGKVKGGAAPKKSGGDDDTSKWVSSMDEIK